MCSSANDQRVIEEPLKQGIPHNVIEDEALAGFKMAMDWRSWRYRYARGIAPCAMVWYVPPYHQSDRSPTPGGHRTMAAYLPAVGRCEFQFRYLINTLQW